MKKLLLLVVILFGLFSAVFAQAPMSSAKYNALKEITAVPDGMTYEEFTKIQRELTWKKIFVAAILPGYIHFETGYNTEGIIILGARVIGGTLMGIALYDQFKLTNNIDYSVVIDAEEESDRTERNTILFSTGLAINMLAYAFDWAHGDWIIETERNEVYFKYGLDKERRKALGISYNTQFKVPSITVSFRL